MSSLSKSVSHHFQASSTPCFCPMKCLFPTMCTDRHAFYFSYHCWFSLIPFAVQVINIDSVTSSYCHTLWGFKFEDSLGSQTSQWGQEDACHHKTYLSQMFCLWGVTRKDQQHYIQKIWPGLKTVIRPWDEETLLHLSISLCWVLMGSWVFTWKPLGAESCLLYD